jgi:hypothetical protein
MAIKIVEIECPRCSAGEPEKLSEEQFRCSHCGAIFVVDRGTKPHAVVPRLSPVAPPSRVRFGTVVLVGVAVLAAAGVWSGIQGSRRRAEREEREHVSRSLAPTGSRDRLRGGPRVSISRVEKVEAPVAKITFTKKGRLSIGGDFWLLTYTNAGKIPISRPAAVVSLFDDAGHRVGEQVGYSPVKLLEAGASVPVLVLVSKPPVYARVEIAPQEPRPPSDYDRTPVSVTVVESIVRASYGSMKEAVGTVRNDTAQPVRFIQVVVIGRNAKGELVSLASGYSTTSNLEPKATSGFKVSIGTFEIEAPARYEIFANSSL